MDNTGRIIDTIFRFFRSFKGKMGATSDVAHLSMVQLQTLAFVMKHPASRMRDIADFLQIELPSATSLIEKLVKTGFVTRSIDKKDKRIVKISLTAKGKTLLIKAKRERQKSMKKLLAHLSEKEKETLLFLLEKLTSRLEENEK